VTVLDELLRRHDGALVLDVPAAGRELGLGRSQSYEAAKAGDIPTISVNGKPRVPTGALARLLGDREEEGGE
jgi:hypothetical protein